MKRPLSRQTLALFFVAAAALGFVVPRFALVGSRDTRQETLLLAPALDTGNPEGVTARLLPRADGGVDLDLRDPSGARVGLIRYSEAP